MGVFSSETKVDVFSNALLLTDPDTKFINKMILNGRLSGLDTLQSVQLALRSSMSVHMDRVMTYARNKYTLGTPQGKVQIQNTTVNEEDAATAITTDLNLPYGCVVDWSVETPLTAEHIVLPYLEKKYNYDYKTNRLGIIPAWLTKPVPTSPGPGWKSTGTEYRVSVVEATLTPYTNPLPGEPTAYVTITYSITAATRWIQEWYSEYGYEAQFDTTEITDATQTEDHDTYAFSPSIQVNQSFVIARYFELDSGGQPAATANYWFYQMGSDIHSILEQPSAAGYTNNEMFPVVPIRYNNTDLTDEAHQETDLYKTSRKLLRKVGVDIQDLTDALNAEGSDISKIDHAYVMWGVNLQDPGDACIKYLIAFFDHLHDTALMTQSDMTSILVSDSEYRDNIYRFNDLVAPGGQTVVEEVEYGLDGTSETPYTVTVTRPTLGMSLEEHGLNTGITYQYISSTIKTGSIGAVGTVTMDIGLPVDTTRAFPYTSRTENHDTLILREQIATGAYKEVQVAGLRHYNRIYGDKTVYTRLYDVNTDPTNENFIIPLHYGVCKELSMRERIDLYMETMHLIVQSVEFTEVKWYQKSVFKIFASIVAVVIGFVFQQYWLIKAVALMWVSEVIMMISPDLMLALEIVYLVYSVLTINWGALLNSLADLTVTKALDAVTMLGMAVQLPLKVRLRQLQGEMEGLAVKQEAQVQELEELWDELDYHSYLDPGLSLDRLRQTPLMTPPEQFYASRFLANPGIITLDLPHIYHTQMLKLPDQRFSV
jgi:hypothetical protein